MPEAQKLDTTGLKCPLPVVKTEACIRRLQAGDVLEVIADDPLAVVDIPHFCQEAGHVVEEIQSPEGICVFRVTVGQKKGVSPDNGG